MQVELNFGSSERFSCEIDPQRRFVLHRGPVARADLRARLRRQLAVPLDFPPLAQACVPGDSVVLALDGGTPCAAELVAGIWDVLETCGIEPDAVQILQPPVLNGLRVIDPRSRLPDGIRQQVTWRIHDPAATKQHAYLATTARGDRVYLDRDLIDADVSLAVGTVAYDALLGYRGTHSVFYPGLSNLEAFSKARGEGHQELGPDDERPLRQTIDEVAWLLGTLFAVQVVPAAGGGAADVFAGGSDSVFRRGRQLLQEFWRVPVPERVDLVVAAVDHDGSGTTWEQVGAALAAARRIVSREGRIVLLSDLALEPGPAVDVLRSQRSARNALPVIRKLASDDMIPATQVANACDWARVYFLSQLPGDLIDELFMVPLENERQAARLLEGDSSCVLLGSAQQTWAEVEAE